MTHDGDLEVGITGESIRLGQFIKLANLVATGGEAKAAIAGGEVSVNGEPTTQRGHTLHIGDRVEVAGAPGGAVVAVRGDDGEDYFDEATADDDFDPEKWRNL